MSDFNLTPHVTIMQVRQADMAAEAARNRLIRQGRAAPAPSPVSRGLRLMWRFRPSHDGRSELQSTWMPTSAAIQTTR